MIGAPSPAAQAGTFVVVHSGPEAWTVLDPTAVTRDRDSGQLTAWSVTVQRNLTNSRPPQPGYIRTLSDYDCAQRRLRWRSFLAYSRYGALVMRKENANPDWAPASDGGEGDASLRVLCDGAGGGSVFSATSIGQLVIGLMQVWDAPPDLPVIAAPPPQPAPPKTPKPTKSHKPAP